MEYQIQWVIEIEASSFHEAARKALEIQRDPDSIATYFTVTNKNGLIKGVDLMEASK
jgi:hypothetical protein